MLAASISQFDPERPHLVCELRAEIFEEAQGRSSGLSLVTMLAQPLKGTFTEERRFGARCTLRFRIDDKRQGNCRGSA